MAHGDRAEEASGAAGAAAGAGRLDNSRHLALLPRDGTVGTNLGAETALGTGLGIDDAGDGFNRDLAGIEERSGSRRSRPRLTDRILDVLGRLTEAGEEDTPGRRVDRFELGVRLHEEAVRGLGKGQHARQLVAVRGRLDADRQHDHVELVTLELAGGCVLDGEDEALSVRILFDVAGQTTDISGPRLFGTLEHIFEALAEGSDVLIEDRVLGVRVVVRQQESVLDRVHAADVRTVGPADLRVTGTDTLDETDSLGALLIRGAHEVAVGGPPGADQALELHRGDDVLEPGVAILVHLGRVIDVETGGDDDRAHVAGHYLARIVVVDGLLFTDLRALAASDGVDAQTVVHVEDVGTRNGLRKRDVDRLTR